MLSPKSILGIGTAALLFPTLLHAQTTAPNSRWWTDISDRQVSTTGERRIVPDVYRTVRINGTTLNALLEGARIGTIPELAAKADRVIALPTPDGGVSRFRFMECPVMHPDLQAQLPMIRTYAGFGIDEPGASVRFDRTPHGFHAMVLTTRREAWFIDPYAFGNTTDLICYRKADFRKSLPPDFHYCAFDELTVPENIERRTQELLRSLDGERTGDCQFRTYRLALACTGEYANFHGGTVPLAAAAMVTTLNRVNQMFERDATLTLQLIPDNNDLIYLNSNTDPYTNNDGGTMLDENMSTCNSVIGEDNYDIGHVFSTGGGGVAYLASVCSDYKAGGVTGSSSPVGDPFDIDYVAHEMGHQFNGNHTQNNDCNREPDAAVEVGSGITILGYAGVCSPDVAPHSDAMYGGYTLGEMHSFITGSGHTCDAVTSPVNAPPTANAGVDRTIPRSTPFILSGTGTDADAGNVLTYSWEQMNSTPATQPPIATSTAGPCFRPMLPDTSNKRFLPNLPAVIANTTPTWEVLASVGRTYNFRLTVRDNAPGGGCNAQDDMKVTVNGTAGPFLVTAPNTALTWAGGSTQTVTWNVAGTASAPVNCTNVDILLSTDGGLTWPIILASSTPNDGSHTVILPDLATTTARVIVKASANIFYDMSNANFTITSAAQAQLNLRLWLEGPFDGNTQLMHDSLRAKGLLPLTEPYSAMGFANGGGGGGEITTAGMLATTGNTAIVDWVRVELRSQADPGTLVATRHALLRRNGEVVSASGNSALTFGVATGNYYVAVIHRNHLGTMSLNAVNMTNGTPTLDLRSTATATYGTGARKIVGNTAMLWAGNAVRSSPSPEQLKYTGAGNDRDPILIAVGSNTPNNTLPNVYDARDTNMDGRVKYTGGENDRDHILTNIGSTTPNNVRTQQTP